MRFIYKYSPTGKAKSKVADKNIAKVLNAYNYLEALHVILNKPIADEEGGAAAGVPSASLTFSEFNLSSYLWQLVVNNLQTLPRDFTSAPEFALARAVFFPAGRDGDQRWYNTDRDNFAHLDHILDGFDATRTNGLKGYLLGEVGRLLPVIKSYLAAKLGLVDPEALVPKFESEINDISMLEASELFATGRRVNVAIQTEPSNTAHFEASAVWHAKLLYHVLAANKSGALGLEQLATINCLVEVIGNNLKEVSLYSDEAKYLKLRESVFGIFIEQRNSLAHALELKLVDPTILTSIRAKMGLDLDAVPLEAGTKAFAISLAGGLLLPAETEASVSVKAGSDDEFSAAVRPKASSKKSKSSISSKSNAKAKVVTKEKLSNVEFDILIEQLASITVERDNFSDRTVRQELAKLFVAKMVPYINTGTEVTPADESELSGIINHPSFDANTKVVVYKRYEPVKILGDRGFLSMSEGEIKDSYPRGITTIKVPYSPFETAATLRLDKFISQMMETGALNQCSIRKSPGFIELLRQVELIEELVTKFPSFFKTLINLKSALTLESTEGGHCETEASLLELVIIQRNDKVSSLFLDHLDLLEFEASSLSKLMKQWSTMRSDEPYCYNPKLVKLADSSSARFDLEHRTKFKAAVLISAFANEKMNSSLSKIVSKYVDSSFWSDKYDGESLIELVFNGITENAEKSCGMAPSIAYCIISVLASEGKIPKNMVEQLNSYVSPLGISIDITLDVEAHSEQAPANLLQEATPLETAGAELAPNRTTTGESATHNSE